MVLLRRGHSDHSSSTFPRFSFNFLRVSITVFVCFSFSLSTMSWKLCLIYINYYKVRVLQVIKKLVPLCISQRGFNTFKTANLEPRWVRFGRKKGNQSCVIATFSKFHISSIQQQESFEKLFKIFVYRMLFYERCKGIFTSIFVLVQREKFDFQSN